MKKIKNNKIYYLVEGKTEKKLVEILKNEYIYSGNIRISNPLNQEIAEGFLRSIPKNSIIILIFDTDVNKIDMLEKNIKKINKFSNINDIIFVKQVKNFEDEIINSTDIKDVKELFNSKSISEFKKDFLKANNVLRKLKEKNFKIDKIWIKEDDIYIKYENGGKRIKIKQKNLNIL